MLSLFVPFSGFNVGAPQHALALRAPLPMMAVNSAPPAGFVWADDLSDEADGAAGASSPSAAAVPPSQVVILNDAAAVGAEVCARVEAAAAKAIKEHGHFALSIPGGSVLTMLAGSAPAWADKCTVAYVNHKAVPMDDAALATHAKARAKFLDNWAGVNVIVMDGTSDAQAEALSYEAQLKALPESTLPRDASTGLPVFDLSLIGVGDDGHVGSLYPNRDEVSDTSGRWVLPVEMKQPGSITLSLPVMQASKEVVIAACGVSEKVRAHTRAAAAAAAAAARLYAFILASVRASLGSSCAAPRSDAPSHLRLSSLSRVLPLPLRSQYPQGKSAAMARGIEGDETPHSFPAVGLRAQATWILDKAAASTLSAGYGA
jgi:6-phosphogluconolactonase/glucosamine-6-phosphate isomerase/deaminase